MEEETKRKLIFTLTSSGIVFLIGALLLFLFVYQFSTTKEIIYLILHLLLGIVSGVLTVYVWALFRKRYRASLMKFLVKSTIGRFLVTGSKDLYLEKQSLKERITFGKYISQYLQLFIGFLSLTVLIGSLALKYLVDEGVTFSVTYLLADDLLRAIFWWLMLFLIPMILTIVYPMGWLMMNANLKGWNEKHKINWYVHKKYFYRFNFVISFGSILGAFSSFGFLNALILFFSAFVIYLIPLSIIVGGYYLFVEESPVAFFNEILEIPAGVTSRHVEEISKPESLEESTKEALPEQSVVSTAEPVKETEEPRTESDETRENMEEEEQETEKND